MCSGAGLAARVVFLSIVLGAAMAEGAVQRFAGAGAAFAPPEHWTLLIPSKFKTIGAWIDHGEKEDDADMLITAEVGKAKEGDAKSTAQKMATTWGSPQDPQPTELDGETAWQIKLAPKNGSMAPNEGIVAVHDGLTYMIMAGSRNGHDCAAQVEQLRASWKWIELQAPENNLAFREPVAVCDGAFSLAMPQAMFEYPAKDPQHVLDLAIPDVKRNAPAFMAFVQLFDIPAGATLETIEKSLNAKTQGQFTLAEPFRWEPVKAKSSGAMTQAVKVSMDTGPRSPGPSYLIWSITQLDDKRAVLINFTIPSDDVTLVQTYSDVARKMVESITK